VPIEDDSIKENKKQILKSNKGDEIKNISNKVTDDQHDPILCNPIIHGTMNKKKSFRKNFTQTIDDSNYTRGCEFVFNQG
jgi:hypothetical protein